MGLPKLIYVPVSSNVTLTFQRGPQKFACYYASDVFDNQATSGIRERVFGANNMLISFTMPAMTLGDLTDWATFMKWALAGGQFNFYPNSDLSDYYHCVAEDTGFVPAVVAPGRYTADIVFRVVPDSQAPADPSVVMKRFYGVTT